MNRLILLFVVVFYALQAMPQVNEQRQLTGFVVDGESRLPLEKAQVSVIIAGDSSIKFAATSDKYGFFILPNVAFSKFVLRINFLGYQPILRAVVIPDGQRVTNLDTFFLQRMVLTMDTVEISARRSPMIVKSDTIEFDASYFKTRENSMVEELLKKLPGIYIGRDGVIMINGEVVTKVLVDGRSFFGDDPTLATRNLSADVIDKVQLIDRKSDWAQFTGIRDGKNEKAINLTIKKEHKKGYFGRLSSAYGTNDRFSFNGSLNQFTGDQQLSFLLKGSNINGYQDNGGRPNMAVGGNGNSRSWNGGVNYNKDFGRRLRLNSSYSMNNNYSKMKKTSLRQIMVPDTIHYYEQSSYNTENSLNYVLNTSLEYKVDTSNIISITVGVNGTSLRSSLDNRYSSLDENQKVVNLGSSLLTNGASSPNVSSAILWIRKFNKTGRSLSARGNFIYNGNSRNVVNKSYNTFMRSSGEVISDTVDQQEFYNNSQQVTAISVIYTEPFLKFFYLEFTYNYSLNYSPWSKRTNNFNYTTGKYDSRNDSMTTFFRSVSSLHHTGAVIRFVKGDYDYSLGANIQSSQLKNDDISPVGRQQHVTNYFPSATINYAISRGKRVRLAYSGATQQPDVYQLQPIPDNTNPLYIQRGNPNLKAASIHNFNSGYSSFNPVKMRTFSTSIQMSFALNKIVNSSWFDSLGRQVSQPENVNGCYSLGANISSSIPIRKMESAFNSNTSINFNQDAVYVNKEKSSNRNLNITQNLGFNMHRDVFEFSIGSSVSYNLINNATQRNYDTYFLNFSILFDCHVDLPLGISIGGDLNYIRRAGLKNNYNSNIGIVNVFVSKSIFARKQAIISLQGFDLLNRNVGVSQFIGDNYVEYVETNVLQRLFIVSLFYSFNSSVRTARK